MFTKATKTKSFLRMAIIGTSGSGKTWTALNLACRLGKRIALIDSERGSASKYAGEKTSDGTIFEFDALNLDTFSPLKYVEGIRAASEYDVLIVDSLSHAWSGVDGALQQVDNAVARSKSGNSYFAWREVTPIHNQLVDAILQAPCHVIVTMRTKSEYIIEDVNGKKVPKKVGLAPIQRDGIEYEFDVVGDMDMQNTFMVSKTRCSALQGAVIQKPGKALADTLRAWLTDGAVAAPPAVTKETVRAACKTLAASHGVEAVAEVIKTVGGADRLDNVTADKYPALLAALV